MCVVLKSKRIKAFTGVTRDFEVRLSRIILRVLMNECRNWLGFEGFLLLALKRRRGPGPTDAWGLLDEACKWIALQSSRRNSTLTLARDHFGLLILEQ